MTLRLIALSFFLFTIGCQGPYENASDKKTIIIAFQPLHSFPKKDIEQLRETVERYYGVTTILLHKKEIPSRFFVNVKTPRFRADSIIKELKRTKADTVDYIIGLTSKDISCTKKDSFGNVKSPESKYSDWGIFGLGYRPGPSCVVSSRRIKGQNEKHTFERLQKIVLHELGHNIGLPHCPDEHCFMRDAAEKISTIDAVAMNLCAACKQKINLPTK